MQKQYEYFNPLSLLDQSPDVLDETCDRIAHTLLAGDGPAPDDPLNRLAEMILAEVLMHTVVTARTAKEKSLCAMK